MKPYINAHGHLIFCMEMLHFSYFFHRCCPTTEHYPAKHRAKYFLAAENATVDRKAHSGCTTLFSHASSETNLTPAFWAQLLPKHRELL